MSVKDAGLHRRATSTPTKIGLPRVPTILSSPSFNLQQCWSRERRDFERERPSRWRQMHPMWWLPPADTTIAATRLLPFCLRPLLCHPSQQESFGKQRWREGISHWNRGSLSPILCEYFIWYAIVSFRSYLSWMYWESLKSLSHPR